MVCKLKVGAEAVDLSHLQAFQLCRGLGGYQQGGVTEPTDGGPLAEYSRTCVVGGGKEGSYLTM